MRMVIMCKKRSTRKINTLPDSSFTLMLQRLEKYWLEKKQPKPIYASGQSFIPPKFFKPKLSLYVPFRNYT